MKWCFTMKKIAVAMICMMILLTGCSTKTVINESNIGSYVGAGELTVINTLVKSNGFFVEEVFTAGTLPYDATNKIETENGTYAPVTSELFETYADFEKKIRSTYTEKASEEILLKDKYANIDGKLYFNLAYETDTTEKYTLDWSNAEVEATINADGLYEITAKVKGNAGLKKEVLLLASNENGNIRLTELYS